METDAVGRRRIGAEIEDGLQDQIEVLDPGIRLSIRRITAPRDAGIGWTAPAPRRRAFRQDHVIRVHRLDGVIHLQKARGVIRWGYVVQLAVAGVVGPFALHVYFVTDGPNRAAARALDELRAGLGEVIIARRERDGAVREIAVVKAAHDCVARVVVGEPGKIRGPYVLHVVRVTADHNRDGNPARPGGVDMVEIRPGVVA